jgi:hypothetical protein
MAATEAPALSPRIARRLTEAAACAPCVAAVLLWGPLSLGALLVVAATGTGIAVVGLVRRSGRGSPPVGRRGLAWCGWATAACAWELVTLVDHDLRSLSLLTAPLLAHPALRGPVTVSWLWAGAWLITRPGDRRHRR